MKKILLPANLSDHIIITAGKLINRFAIRSLVMQNTPNKVARVIQWPGLVIKNDIHMRSIIVNIYMQECYYTILPLHDNIYMIINHDFRYIISLSFLATLSYTSAAEADVLLLLYIPLQRAEKMHVTKIKLDYHIIVMF